jgi:hypothetical protein
MVIMKSGLAALCATAVAAAALSAAPAGAETTNRLTQCNAEWSTMKANGTVGDRKYTDFRKECLARLAAPEVAPAPAPAPSAAPPAAQPPAARPPGSQSAAPAAPPAPAVAGEAVFPSAVSPKYASESAGKARMHTCLDQYHTNKATGGNASLKWIQRGGGYYSECNKRLKG